MKILILVIFTLTFLFPLVFLLVGQIPSENSSTVFKSHSLPSSTFKSPLQKEKRKNKLWAECSAIGGILLGGLSLPRRVMRSISQYRQRGSRQSLLRFLDKQNPSFFRGSPRATGLSGHERTVMDIIREADLLGAEEFDRLINSSPYR